jgi:hypothetical protein
LLDTSLATQPQEHFGRSGSFVGQSATSFLEVLLLLLLLLLLLFHCCCCCCCCCCCVCLAQILRAARSDPEKLHDIVDTLTKHCIAVQAAPPLDSFNDLLGICDAHADVSSIYKVRYIPTCPAARGNYQQLMAWYMFCSVWQASLLVCWSQSELQVAYDDVFD